MQEVVEFVDVEVKAVTDKALLVKVPEADDQEIWFPSSQIQWESTDVANIGDVGTLAVTKWIAQQKDLI